MKFAVVLAGVVMLPAMFAQPAKTRDGVAEGGGVDVAGGDDDNNESLVVFALP